MKSSDAPNHFSASAQGLGYLYQGRLALLQMFYWPEDTVVQLEKDDDLDFSEANGRKTLTSLKHKAEGGRLTDLSVDFWRSVRVWVEKLKSNNLDFDTLRFCLMTTEELSSNSSLVALCSSDRRTRTELAQVEVDLNDSLKNSKSREISSLAESYQSLDFEMRLELLSRIVIIDNSPRIVDIPEIIKDQYMRTVVREHRNHVFERLEGWWGDLVISVLDNTRKEGISNREISDKLAFLAAEYTLDNLPITFWGESPESSIDIQNDPRLFVHQLRDLGIGASRIHNAILDYYRAFEQRSEWARENLLVSGELEDFESRLIDEWARYRDVLLDELDEESADSILAATGVKLYRWMELETGNYSALRIRPKVDEPFVVRGSYHILANGHPEPSVYWHPEFLSRIQQVLGVEG